MTKQGWCCRCSSWKWPFQCWRSLPSCMQILTVSESFGSFRKSNRRWPCCSLCIKLYKIRPHSSGPLFCQLLSLLMFCVWWRNNLEKQWNIVVVCCCLQKCEVLVCFDISPIPKSEPNKSRVHPLDRLNTINAPLSQKFLKPNLWETVYLPIFPTALRISTTNTDLNICIANGAHCST